MKKRIQRKIEALREEPEHVRVRTVSYVTFVAGIALVVLWLSVFLPLQLYFQRSGTESVPSENEVADTQVAPTSTVSPRPQIGGIQDRADLGTPTPSTESLPVVSSPSTELPIVTTSPTP